MKQTFHSNSAKETHALAQAIAEKNFSNPRVFISLKGTLGAGKTEFARAFIRRWLELAGDVVPSEIPSPSYTIVQTYGNKRPLAHLDLYRVKAFEELEQIGFDLYFFEQSCCLVEWLDQIPEARTAAPPYAIEIDIELGDEKNESTRKITLTENLKKS